MTAQTNAAKDFLDALRWKADTAIWNHEGEHVWLKQIPHGITDCCAYDEPCEYHAPMREAGR